MPFANHVTLMGNVTRDPELAKTPKGTSKLELGLAINRTYTVEGTGEQREEVVFVDLIFWNKSAENVAKHVTKGRTLYVEGRLVMDTWDDKQTGQKRSKLRVQVNNFQFIGGSRPAAESTAGAGEDDGRTVTGRREGSRPPATRHDAGASTAPRRPAEPDAEGDGDDEDPDIF